MAKRHIMRLELRGPAKKALEDASELHGMTQVALMSRLVEFFASRDLDTQIGMVAQLPGMEAEIQKRILRSLGG